MTIPEQLRDEVLHIIALGRGRYGWHAIASRLSGKDVPRAVDLQDVLRHLREQGHAEAVDDGEGGVRWVLTEGGCAVLSARRTAPSSATFAHAVRSVGDVLLSDSGELGADPLVAEPTPDESAWLAILVDDARFALRSSATEATPSTLASDDRVHLRRALEHARQTGDWRTFMMSLRERPKLPPSVDLYFRGRAWHALGFFGLAAALYHRAVRIDPHGHYLYVSLLNALADSEQWDRLRSAIEDVRNDPSAHLELALTAEVVAYRAALADRDSASRPGCELIANRLSELLAEPASAEVLSSIQAAGASAAALCFDATGMETRARNFAARATRCLPESGWTWFVRGLIGHRHGSSKAREHLRTACSLLPGFVWPRVYLAHLDAREGRYYECIEGCDQALPLAPSDAVRAALHEWRGISRAATAGFDREARADLLAAVRLDPRQPSYRANLAAFDRADEPSMYDLQVSEALHAQATRAVSSASVFELAA